MGLYDGFLRTGNTFTEYRAELSAASPDGRVAPPSRRTARATIGRSVGDGWKICDIYPYMVACEKDGEPFKRYVSLGELVQIGIEPACSDDACCLDYIPGQKPWRVKSGVERKEYTWDKSGNTTTRVLKSSNTSAHTALFREYQTLPH